MFAFSFRPTTTLTGNLLLSVSVDASLINLEVRLSSVNALLFIYWKEVYLVIHLSAIMPLKVKLTSVLVDDQDKALEFYTNVLGFIKKTEIDMGEAKWLTVVSPDSDYVELVLEPKLCLEEAKTYTKALKGAGIPATAFEVDDIKKEYQQLKEKGVHFKSEPEDSGAGIVLAIFDDTCGNWIQIYEAPPKK